MSKLFHSLRYMLLLTFLGAGVLLMLARRRLTEWISR